MRSIRELPVSARSFLHSEHLYLPPRVNTEWVDSEHLGLRGLQSVIYCLCEKVKLRVTLRRECRENIRGYS